MPQTNNFLFNLWFKKEKQTHTKKTTKQKKNNQHLQVMKKRDTIILRLKLESYLKKIKKSH